MTREQRANHLSNIDSYVTIDRNVQRWPADSAHGRSHLEYQHSATRTTD